MGTTLISADTHVGWLQSGLTTSKQSPGYKIMHSSSENPKPIIIPDPLDPPPGFIPIGVPLTIPGHPSAAVSAPAGEGQAVGMPISGLFTHAYLCGTTGCGKSNLLEWLLYGLCKNQEWVPGQSERGAIIAIDPHGEMVDNLIEAISRFAPERIKDVVILDFGDVHRPIGFNPLNIKRRDDIEPTVSAVKEMILKMLNLNPDLAPRAVNYAEQATWALCEANLRGLDDHPELHLNLLQMAEFFTNQDFRHLVMQFCTNPGVLSTFGVEGTFEMLGQRQQLDHVMPILRSFVALSTKESFANVFGQSVSEIQFERWVREGKIVLIKLSMTLGSEASVSASIGSMLTPMFLASAYKWALEPDLRAILAVDEFQEFASESFKTIMAQGRKYGIGTIIANQIPADLPEHVLRGAQSNVQTKFKGLLNEDGDSISRSILRGRTQPTTESMRDLRPHEFWANVCLEGLKPSGPMKIRALAPLHQQKPEVAPVEQPFEQLGSDAGEVLNHRTEHVRQAVMVMEAKVRRAAS